LTKIQVTPDEFVAEANRLLHADSEFEEGMNFRPFPEGAVEAGFTGYQYDGKWRPVYQRAWDKAYQEYEIKL
jgi:hypothetical protein